QALQARGGWQNRDSAAWFAASAALLGAKLGDRVKSWVTQNEPELFVGIGHLEGWHAPGQKLKFADYLVAAHNSLRAHGKAVQALRSNVAGAKIGYVMAAQVARPATERPEDIEAARTAMFAIHRRCGWDNAWWADPVILGRYPEDGIAFYGSDMPN